MEEELEEELGEELEEKLDEELEEEMHQCQARRGASKDQTGASGEYDSTLALVMNLAVVHTMLVGRKVAGSHTGINDYCQTSS